MKREPLIINGQVGGMIRPSNGPSTSLRLSVTFSDNVSVILIVGSDGESDGQSIGERYRGAREAIDTVPPPSHRHVVRHQRRPPLIRNRSKSAASGEGPA